MNHKKMGYFSLRPAGRLGEKNKTLFIGLKKTVDVLLIFFFFCIKCILKRKTQKQVARNVTNAFKGFLKGCHAIKICI